MAKHIVGKPYRLNLISDVSLAGATNVKVHYRNDKREVGWWPGNIKPDNLTVTYKLTEGQINIGGNWTFYWTAIKGGEELEGEAKTFRFYKRGE